MTTGGDGARVSARVARVNGARRRHIGGTRAAILDYLRGATAPVGVAEICDAFGLNHTGVRRHLANLRDEGLVEHRYAPPSGRGRPTLEFSVTSAAQRTGDVTEGRQRDLIRLLLEMVTTGEDARVIGRRAGERLAAEVRAVSSDERARTVAAAAPQVPGGDAAARVPGGDAVPLEETLRSIETAARRMGFDPARQLGPDGQEEVVLRHCPFADGALLAPEVVCELHLGMVEGVAASIGSNSRMAFAFADPRTAGCRLVVD